MAQIHWFPGHMKKALNELTNLIKLADIIIELVDARAPLSSLNPNFEKFSPNKKRLLILTKCDLADKDQTIKIMAFLKTKCSDVLLLNLKDKKSAKIILEAIKNLGKEKHQKEISRCMKPQPLKVAIIGIPNVGKSSLINLLAGRHFTKVENKPGLTKKEQWIKINNDCLLLDTPGILPMSYKDKNEASKIALIGSIKETILPNTDLVIFLLDFLKQHYPNALKARYDIENISDYQSVLTQISLRRGLYTSDGKLDFVKAEYIILKDFKDGLLGMMSLDII